MPTATLLLPVVAARIEGMDFRHPSGATWIRDTLARDLGRDARTLEPTPFTASKERRHMVRATASYPTSVH